MTWQTIRKAIWALTLVALGAGAVFFIFQSEPNLNPNFENERQFVKNHPFRLGLDLSGGSHLIYSADLSGIESGEADNAMEALRDVIERRVNIFGVSEPVVQIQKSSFISGGEEKLIVDLPGVTDLEKAVAMIGQTPLLQFKTEAPAGASQKATVDKDGQITIDPYSQFVDTELTGRYLKKSLLQFDPNTRAAYVALEFDETGANLFAEITKQNAGKTIAIFLDGAPISIPKVGEEYKTTGITGGQAIINGNFTPDEAKQLVGRLNSGALPVPITLISTQTIGATLGGNAVAAGIKATMVGFLLVVIFLVLWYRLPGLLAAIALSMFVVLMLTIFKLLPVTLTAAGIAGFIITIGVAVDANVLIFERIKEEMRSGKTVLDAVSAGFSRAWFSIRDSNLSGIITAIILYWLGTPMIKGFALTFGLGIAMSLFSAIMVTKIFLSLFSFVGNGRVARFLFSSGVSK